MKKYDILKTIVGSQAHGLATPEFSRICPDCKTIIFYKYKRSCDQSEKNKSSCRKCTVAKYERNRIALRKSDPKYKARMRLYSLKRRYGLSPEGYNNLLLSQGGQCAVCPSKDLLFVDHDHVTGLNRGLLCRHHNLMLGYMEKDIQVVDKLVDYLLFHKEQSR